MHTPLSVSPPRRPWLRRGLIPATVLVLAVLTACERESPVEGVPGEPGPGVELAPAPQQLSTSGVLTLNDRFAQLADEVPGFGGLFYDENGRLTVFLTDPSTQDEARDGISRFLRERVVGRGPGAAEVAAQVAGMRVLEAR